MSFKEFVAFYALFTVFSFALGLSSLALMVLFYVPPILAGWAAVLVLACVRLGKLIIKGCVKEK